MQSLLTLAYIHKTRVQMLEATDAPLYHRPLLLALVNSVNTDDADLKLFFHQLERIAKGELGRDAFRRAKADLWAELNAEPEWLYEELRFTLDQALFDSLTLERCAARWSSMPKATATIEVLMRPSNDKELAFKLQTTSAPFALIRIGDTTDWLKEVLAGYEIRRRLRR